MRRASSSRVNALRRHGCSARPRDSAAGSPSFSMDVESFASLASEQPAAPCCRRTSGTLIRAGKGGAQRARRRPRRCRRRLRRSGAAVPSACRSRASPHRSPSQRAPCSKSRAASMRYGRRMRLTRKPGLSFTSTGSLPICCTKRSARCATSGAVCAPVTTSTSCIRCTGLKKWMPMTRSRVLGRGGEFGDGKRRGVRGEHARLADQFIETAEDGFLHLHLFDRGFDDEIARASAALRSARGDARHAGRASRSVKMRPLYRATHKQRQHCAMPAATRAGSISRRITRKPRALSHCAMPAPITPAPMTAARVDWRAASLRRRQRRDVLARSWRKKRFSNCRVESAPMSSRLHRARERTIRLRSNRPRRASRLPSPSSPRDNGRASLLRHRGGRSARSLHRRPH